MARSPAEFPRGDIIDLDHYMTSPVFQYANEPPLEEKCVIDAGTFEPRKTEPQPPIEYNDPYTRSPDGGTFRSTPAQIKRSPPQLRPVPASDCNAPYNRRRERYRDRSPEGSESSYTCRDSRDQRRQYSLDSGVSDGGHGHRHRQSGFHSNVDFYERRRRRDFEQSSRKLSNRNTYQDLSPGRSQSGILRTLREQQERLDRLAALCEERLLPPAPARPKAREPRAGSRASSSSDLSSSIATREETPTKKHTQEKSKKLHSSEMKTYKILLRKLDELNERFTLKQQAAVDKQPLAPAKSSSYSRSSGVSVSDKGVCTSLPKVKESKPKTASARTRARLARNHASSSSRSPRGSAARAAAAGARGERSDSLDSADARRLRHIYAAFARSERETVTSRRSRIGDYDANLFGMKDYNLNDPISFYNRAKRPKRFKTPVPPPQPAEVNLCLLCRGCWSRVHQRGRDFCKRLLCCGEGGASVASGLIKGD